jgi:hypothetical protein
MTTLTTSSAGAQILRELQEYASFPAATQDYIRRALEVRSGGTGALAPPAGGGEEAQSLAARIAFYGRLDEIAAAIPVDDDLAAVAGLMRWLVPLTAFDIAHAALGSFAAYRFLYERLLGAAVRPWLLGAFCTAAALPQLHPQHRLQLLRSIDESCAGPRGRSIREPAFYPQEIEEQDA